MAREEFWNFRRAKERVEFVRCMALDCTGKSVLPPYICRKVLVSKVGGIFKLYFISWCLSSKERLKRNLYKLIGAIWLLLSHWVECSSEFNLYLNFYFFIYKTGVHIDVFLYFFYYINYLYLIKMCFYMFNLELSSSWHLNKYHLGFCSIFTYNGNNCSDYK